MAAVARTVCLATQRLCLPATCVLAGSLVALALKGPARSAVHLRSLGAHVTTLLALELSRALYVTGGIECGQAVLLQNYIDISAGCWLHTICFNNALCLRNNYNARRQKTKIILNLAYALCIPFAIMIGLDRFMQGSFSEMPGFMYDAKTCFADEGSFENVEDKDASIYFSMTRGISMMLTSVLFLYLCYKSGFRRQRAILCEDDRDNATNIYTRQNQALNYTLLIVATGVVEVSADLGAWYFRHCQTELAKARTDARSTSALPYRFLLGEFLCKTISFIIDFIRVLFICELLCLGGPKDGRQDQPVQTEDPLPPYEEARRLPDPRVDAMLAPPPSYSSLFRDRTTEEDTFLLEAAQPTAQDTPVLVCSEQTDSTSSA